MVERAKIDIYKVCLEAEMKVLWMIMIGLMLYSCGEVHKLPEFEYTPEVKEYEYVWLDDEVPADFDPAGDYLYLDFDMDGDTWTCRVNPYSLRVSLLCADPLCFHKGERSCPYYGVGFIHGDVVSDGKNLFYVGNQHTVVMGYNGYTGKMEEMDSRLLGLNSYHPESGKLTELVNHKDFFREPFDIDVAYADGWVYYYCEVPVRADGVEIQDENGKTVTETRLFRIQGDGKGKAEDLGLYMGYTELIVRDGFIWNYYGFLNESDVWEGVNQDNVIRTDLNNQNPAIIPCYEQPVDDIGGYWLPYSGAMFLIYNGGNAEAHILRSDEPILYYDEGFIWTNEALEEQWEENGVIKSKQTDVTVVRKNIQTGEAERIENPPVPKDAVYLDAAAVVGGRYIIYTVYDTHPAASGAFAKLYYLRLDTENSEVYPIYP